MNPEKVNQLYNFLADNGVEDIGTDMSFMARMQNPKDRKTLYDFLDDNKVEGIGTTFTEFEQILGVDEAPSAKMPSFEDFKEATVAQSRQSVEGRLAEARESLSRTTATDFATEKLFKPHTDIVQEERDYVLRPTEKVLNNIFESNKQYREQKEGAKNAQTHYAAGAGAIKTPQMDTVSKVSHIGKDEYKYLKGQRDIALSNINNLIEEAHKIQKQMIEEGGGSVKGVNSITGAQITLPSKEAVKIGNLITILEDTRDKYDKMVTKADKEHGKKGGFVAGLGEIDLLNVLTAGWADVFKNIDPAVAIHKASYGGKLTPEEQLYLKMFEEQARLDGIIKAEGGTTTGYNIGSGLAESLPFITSMLTTGGVASAVKGGVTKGLGAIGREAAKEGAEKSLKNIASRAVNGVVGSAAATAATIPLQAGMYNNYIDNAFNEYMTYGRLTDSPIQRMWKSYADAFTDVFTENLGGIISGAAKYMLNGVGAKTAFGRLFGTVGRRIQPFYQDILKRTAFNGFVGEFEEEMLANFLSPLMRGDSKEERNAAWKEAFGKENIITTLATTALMSAGFGAGKVVSAADATRKYEKFKTKARNALANIEDRRLEQQLVDIMALPTLQERCQAFANMNWQGDYKSMGHGVDYFYNSILKEVYDGVVKMEDANEVVMPTLRTLNTVVDRGTSDIVTAQMDGKPVYIIRGVGDNAESVIVQDMEGNRQQVAMSSLQEVNVTPVSEVVADLINKEYNAISAEMDAQEQAEEDATLRERGLVPPSDRAKADQFEPEEVVMVNGKTATINSIDKASGTARVDIEGEEVNQQVNIADMQKITPEQISSEVEAQQINQPALTQDGEIDIVTMGEEQTANYISEKADASYVEDMLADRRKKLERAQKGIRLPLNLAERQKAIEQRDAEIARLEQEIAMWEGVKNRLTQPQPTSEVAQETADVAEAQEVVQQEVTPEQVVEQTTEEVVFNATSLDKQGNPIDKDGNLLVDVVESIDDITDEDFDNPTRSIQLPALPNNVDEAIGADGKPVIIKKNIFERNAVSHSDLTPEQSRQILKSALYSPKLYGQNQKRRKPYNWVVISVQDESAPNKLVLLEVNEGKDNVEIVHWHYIDQRGLEKLKRQAEREDGQLLILPSEVSEEVGALADPTLNQPSTDKNTTSVPENQTSEQKNVTEEEKTTEQTPEKEVEDTAEDIHTREQVDALEWKAGVVMNEEARNHKTTKALDDMAKAAGVRVAFVDSIVEGGKEANGLYDPRTKTIYIASDRLKGANFVAGHEMLHHIKTLSPQAYKEYMEAVKAEVGAERFEKAKEGLRQTYRIAILGSLKKRGIVTDNTSKEERESLIEREMPSDEVLTEEVVADWTGSLIGYSGGFSDFVKRYKGGAVLRVLRNAVEHIGTFFKGRNSWERTMQRRLKALDTLLEDAIGEAKQSKEVKKLTEAMTPSKEVVEVAETIPNTQGAESKMSLMIAPTLEAQSAEYFNRYYQGKNASARFRPVSKVMSEDALKVGNDAISAMVEIMAPHIDDVVFGKRLLPEEVYGKGYTTIFKNGSYGRSMENTTNCVRTLAYNEFTDEVKKQIGRPLTTAESFLASQMLYDIAKDPQCLYCYVSLDRKAYDEFLLRYLRERDVMLKQYAEMEEKTPEGIDALYNTYLNGRKDTKPMRERFEKLISIVDNGGTLISGYDLMTREKRNEMRETSEDMRWQIDDAEKYAQGASWAKKEEEYRAYAGEILKMPFSIVKQLSEEYGLRFYSFSEYTPAFIVENMQMVRDAALRGLRGFAYTKEVDFVKIFAPTGMNMNVSTFGRVDSEGNVVPDERQGASWEEVKALREQYPNVGATFVATDDAMVEWALAQDWVDVVIPFHIVRTGADVAEFYKWTNYSSQQSDIKDGKKADIMPTEHHNDLETYLALCDERGITPRFSQWRENPNYMKLVNETRRSVDETPVLQPSFNLEAAQESWNNFVEKGGYYGGWYEVDEQGFNEAVEQVASDIEAGKSAKDVDYGRQDIPADYAERARQARINKSHGNTPKLSIKEMDAPYLEAVERGDMGTAQRMVDEAARLAGYSTDESWRMQHRAPMRDEENSNPFDTEKIVPEDYWEHPEWYSDVRHNSSTRESFYNMLPAIRKYKQLVAEGKQEDADKVAVKMYRGVDKTANKREGSFRNGDWITPSRRYAIESAPYGKARVIEQEVPLKNIWWDGNSMNEWGYDDGSNYTYRDTKNNRKLLDPVTYDDNGNVIPLSERFNPRKADIRFSLIGEIGARNLDIAEEATTRLDNLAVAREMEQAGKDAKTIKMATGWERGADYFWRYEVDDVRFVNPEEWVNKKGKLTLKDIVTNADELFAAYPELKDVKIKKSTAMGNGGAYNRKDNTITISVGTLRRGFEIQNNVEGFNTSKEKIDRLMDTVINVELRGTLVHEIQHAIQHIEDFARGGNPKMVNPALSKAKVVAFEQEMINQINEKVHQYNSMSTIERRTPKGSQLRVQIQKGKKKLAKFQKEIVLGKEGYRKLAGEVEARNIEKRLGLTPEERRATLAEATEDVARDDQIFILYGMEMAEKQQSRDTNESANQDVDYRFSIRLPEYQERFSQLTEEYNALDKNDAKALADFRARKRTLVEEYWNDFARALGANVETMVIDSTNNPEALRPIYNIIKETSGHGTSFEEFVDDYNSQEDGSAFLIPNTHIIVVDMAKIDNLNTQKEISQIFVHENVHRIIEENVSKRDLARIWRECAGKDFGKLLRKGYPKDDSATLGNEMLAYSIAGLKKTDITPLFDFIEGVNNISVEEVMAMYKNTLPLRNEIASKILTVIKDEYNRERELNDTMDEETLSGLWGEYVGDYGGGIYGRRRDGGYSAGETYIENGRRVTVLDEDFSIVEDIPEFDESPKYSLKDPIEQLRKENGIVAKSFEKENELIAEKFGTESVGRKIEKGIFNYLADVQRLQDNLYAAGVVRSDDNDFVNKMEGVRNMVERALPQELEKYVYPLLKVISTITKKFGFDYTAISDYLAAKHSIEREDESKIQTMSTEANAVWNRERVEKIVSDFESKVPENVRELLWKGVKGIEQRTLEILKKVGVYTAADIEAIQSHNWKYYVPLQGWDTKEEELIEVNKIYDLPQSGTSSTNGRWQEHDAKGRRTKPYDPLATIVAKLHKAVYVAETNKAMHALYNLVTDATRALGTEKVSFIFKASDAYYRKTQDGYEEIDADEVTPEELESNRKLHAELRKLYNERKQTDDAATIKKIDAQIKAAKSKLTIFVKAGDMAIPKEVNISQQTTRARRVYFYMNGKRMYIQFVNPKYSAAINGQTLWKRNELDKFVAGWTRWLSQTYTSLNPEFSFVTNPIRDFRDAVITHLLDAEHGNIVGFVQYMRPNSGARSAIFRAQRGTAQPLSDKELEEYNLKNRDDRKALIRKYGEKRVYDTLFKWYADNGGVTGGGRVYSVQTVADDLKKNAEKLKQGDISTHDNVYDALSDSAEITTRFATFLASLDKGESVRQAVVNGRNVSVNFNRKGAWSDKIGAYHSFFNASAQGIYKYLTLARKYPKRFVAVAMSQIALGYATCLLIDYLYDLLLPDDDGDEIQTIEIPLWERLGYTAIPFMRRNGKVHTIRIPKSITFASFSAIGVLLNEVQKQRITGEEAILAAASQMMSSWTYGFSEGAPFWRAAVPTVLQPIADIMNNTDAFGREVYRTDRFKQGIPNSELGLRNVIPWMYSMTKALNKATGGNEFKSGVIDINPSMVQYIMEQYAGGFGVLARKTIEFGASLFTDKVEFEMQNLPLLGRLTYTIEPKSWYPDYKKVQDAFGAAVFSNARNQYQAGYITEDELRQIGMRNYIFKNNDKVIKNLIDLRGNYAPSSMEYKVINREINRQRGLVVKIFEEADFNNRDSISEIIKKYDPNRSNNLTNLYKEYAK